MFVRTPEVPVHQATLIWRGERAGRLRDAVARAADNRRRAIRDSRASKSGSGMQYALTVMVVLLGLVGLVGIKIIPKYIEIFEDFETELPWVTRMMFEWAGVFGPLLVLTGGVAMLGIIGWSTYGLFYSAEGVAGPLRRWLEPVWWRVPVLSHSTRSRALADACFTIEQAMRAGRPLPEAIDAARHPAQSGVLDRRLRRLAEGLRRGRPLPDAARAARLPALVVGMLGTASAASDPADVFAFLCRYYTHRVSPAEAVLRAAALPVLTLVMAAAVAWFVFAVFYPLIVLIERCIDVTGYA
jgi:type II secretory pathway component PulF